MEPLDPEFEARVRKSFAKQAIMTTLGARVARVGPGEVDIELPFRSELTQQHGYIHAGVVGTILDSACGYAALSLMPSGAAVLTAEYKVNLLSPAAGDLFVARGKVMKAGKTLIVARADAFAIQDGREKIIATMLATIMTIRDRGISD